MRRESHVRFCEGGGVRFPSATRLVMGFQHQHEAEQCLAAWRERLGQFGLELHPDKTRLLAFGRYAASDRKRRGEGKPETFDFLGFTHVCGRTRSTDRFWVHRRSSMKRLRKKLAAVKTELQRRWHDPVPEVGQWLRRVIQGFYNYHAVPGNWESLRCFSREVCRMWFRRLRRRSQKRHITWARFAPVAALWIPRPRILHPYPYVRFDATHPK